MIFIYCKLCGKHLYKEITFKNLFKFNYYIHEECEDLLNMEEYLVIPLLDKLIFFDYLFEEKYKESDTDFLYEKYSYLLFKRMLYKPDWSIVVFIEKKLDNETIILIMKLAQKAVLFLSVFDENFL